MSDPVQCKTCDQSIPHEAYPWHSMNHRIDGFAEEVKDQLQAVSGQIGESVKAAVGASAVQLAEALKPLHERLGKLDPTPGPEDVQEHIKGCTRCKARWDPVFVPKPPPAPAAEPPKVEGTPLESAPPVASTAPMKPKRAAFVPRELSPFKLRAFQVEPIATDGGKVQLRVPNEQAAQLATREQVAPKCRWVKEEDGWHYACEEG